MTMQFLHIIHKSFFLLNDKKNRKNSLSTSAGVESPPCDDFSKFGAKIRKGARGWQKFKIFGD